MWRSAYRALDDRRYRAAVVAEPCGCGIGLEIVRHENRVRMAVADETKRAVRRHELELRLQIRDALQIALFDASRAVVRFAACGTLVQPALLIGGEAILLIGARCLRCARVDIGEPAVERGESVIAANRLLDDARGPRAITGRLSALRENLRG